MIKEYDIQEVVPFTLSSTYISTKKPTTNYYPYNAVVSSDVGYLAKYKTELFFNSINLKELLGDLYDKYDEFNLELTTILVMRQAGVAVLNSNVLRDYRVLNVWIEGFDWVRSSYNQKTGNERGKALLTFLADPTNGYFTSTGMSYYPNTYELTNLRFRKSTQNISIKINLGSLSDAYNEYIPDILTLSTQVFPHTIFKFNITPAK